MVLFKNSVIALVVLFVGIAIIGFVVYMYHKKQFGSSIQIKPTNQNKKSFLVNYDGNIDDHLL